MEKKPTGLLLFYLLPTVLVSVAVLSAYTQGLSTLVGLPEDLSVLHRKPWSIFTYFLVHRDPLHLGMSILLLHFCIRLCHLSIREFASIFMLGVLLGGITFLLLFPQTGSSGSGVLLGASAGICALVPCALYRTFVERRGGKRTQFISGIMIIILVVDFVSFFWSGSPGFSAHLGGYFVGIIALVPTHLTRRRLLRRREVMDHVYAKAHRSGIGALSREERRLLIAETGRREEEWQKQSSR